LIKSLEVFVKRGYLGPKHDCSAKKRTDGQPTFDPVNTHDEFRMPEITIIEDFPSGTLRKILFFFIG